MAVCSRCQADNQQPSATCTQCGYAVAPAEAGLSPAAPRSSAARIILWAVLIVLLVTLFTLVLNYLAEMNRLVK